MGHLNAYTPLYLAELGLAPDEVSRWTGLLYGAMLPALTASYIGFVNGDTRASLTAPPALASLATAASHVGDYVITSSGAV